jgi:type IX secretion system PorP/SprF family membrane protein
MKSTAKKLSVLLCASALICGTATAQFGGVRSQFLMTTLLDNPASAGNAPCLDMRMGVRHQWAGFDGAPVSNFASLSSRLGGGGATLSHGLGGYVLTDEIGPWSNTRFSMAYSSKVRLANNARLSAGVAVGMVQYRLDIGSLEFPEYSASEDPALFGSVTSQTVFPTMDFGLWYEDKTTFAAFSLQNVTSTTLTDLAGQTSSGRIAVVTAGHVVKLDRRFSFRPAAQMRLASGLPASIDFQGTFSLDNRISMGLGYRTGSALVGLMNVKLFDSMTVGYAYDLGVNALNVAARGSHEIVLSLTACDKNDPYIGPNGRCPAYD